MRRTIQIGLTMFCAATTALLTPPAKAQTNSAPVLEPLAVQCAGRDDTAALTSATSTAHGRPIVIRANQVCAGGNISLANLVIERGARLRPLSGQTITLSGVFEAGRYQIFENALAGQGRVIFDLNASVASIYPQWWQANVSPGTTDMTGAAQAALNATSGRGSVFFPAGSYLITATLTLPEYSTPYSPIVIDGDGPFSVSLINKAPAGKPTLLVNRDAVIIRNIGFWGHADFRNDGIQIYGGHRIFVQGCELLSNGNAITLQEAHSIFIQNNFGHMSGGSGLRPTGSSAGWTFAPTDSFIKVNLPKGGWVNHLVVKDNINEGYSYQLLTTGPANAISWVINGNQFEGSTHGLKLENLFDYEISGNYLGEGGSGYSIDIANSRRGRIGPNYIHFDGFDAKTSTLRLQDVQTTLLMGSIPRLYLLGSCSGLVADATQIDRIQDETSNHTLSLNNSIASDIGGIPLATLNSQSGRATWYSDTVEISAYPTARVGDRILKTGAGVGDSIGWICTRAASAGALTQAKGRGPSPAVLGDYASAEAFEFRITVLTGGPTGAATYKVEWKPLGSGTFADLTKPITTSELAHLVKRETDSGPTATFAIHWPTSRSYVAGDQWVLNQVVAPTWMPIR